MYETTYPNKRFAHTAAFLESTVAKSATILDLGVPNPFSEIMQELGYTVLNTEGEDLDLDTTTLKNTTADAVTAFEIFEHLLSPFTVLRDIKANSLVASIPLKLWFSPAYRSKTDPWDRHYHEFEDWQFDWLLDKAGWQIKKREKFTHPVKKNRYQAFTEAFYPALLSSLCRTKTLNFENRNHHTGL